MRRILFVIGLSFLGLIPITEKPAMAESTDRQANNGVDTTSPAATQPENPDQSPMEKRWAEIQKQQNLPKVENLDPPPAEKRWVEIQKQMTTKEGGLPKEQVVPTTATDTQKPAGTVNLQVPATPTPPPVNASRPFYETWWFWGTVGGVIVAGSITAILLTHGSESPCSGINTTACVGVK